MLTPDKGRRRRRRTAVQRRRAPEGTHRFLVVRRPVGDGPHACPCCGYLTLEGRGLHEICGVCGWDDDGQSDADADKVRGGPNHDLSLTRARDNFAAFGASDERRLAHVRPPRDDEHPLAPGP